MGQYLSISSYIRKPFLIYNFATATLRISLYMRKIQFSFLSVHSPQNKREIDGIQNKKENNFFLNVAVCPW
jgi:hypothetical protein